MSKVLPILSSLALTFAFASPVYANCDQARLHVFRSEGSAGGVQIFDFAPGVVLPTSYLRYSTTNPVIIDNLNSAWVGHLTVRVIGNAASCPTTGIIRDGGTILTIFRDTAF